MRGSFEISIDSKHTLCVNYRFMRRPCVFAVEAFRHVVYLVHLGSLHAAVNLRRLRIAGCGGLPGEIPGIIPGGAGFPGKPSRNGVLIVHRSAAKNS